VGRGGRAARRGRERGRGGEGGTHHAEDAWGAGVLDRGLVLGADRHGPHRRKPPPPRWLAASLAGVGAKPKVRSGEKGLGSKPYK